MGVVDSLVLLDRLDGDDGEGGSAQGEQPVAEFRCCLRRFWHH